MMKEQTASGRFFTAPVLTLMALGFVLGSCEYVVVAILPDIARGLNVSLGAAGKLVGVPPATTSARPSSPPPRAACPGSGC